MEDASTKRPFFAYFALSFRRKFAEAQAKRRFFVVKRRNYKQKNGFFARLPKIYQKKKILSKNA